MSGTTASDMITFLEVWFGINALPAFIPAISARKRGLSPVQGYIAGLIFTWVIAWIFVRLTPINTVELAKRNIIAARARSAAFEEAGRQLARGK